MKIKQDLLSAIREANRRGAKLPNLVSHDDGVKIAGVLNAMGIDHNLVGTPIWDEWIAEAGH